MSNSDNSLEQLLSKATPRPVPEEAHVAHAREALRDEWRGVTSKRRSRKRLVSFAIAATVLIGVFSLFNTLRVPHVDVVQVASIQKSFGSISFIGQQSIVMPAGDLTSVSSGQTIATGADAGIALAWVKGGSVRLDANTTVEFKDEASVYLHRGQIYFDSMPSNLLDGTRDAQPGAFLIETPHGVVTHIGTQFMTNVDGDVLGVSVREGQVSVDGNYHAYTAQRGKRVEFSGRARPVELSISEHGDEWRWVGRTSPVVDVDGQSIDVFLQWVSRELGREVVYSDAARTIALRNPLIGTVDKAPEEALRLRMLTTPLDYKIDEGKIHVSQRR